MPRTINYDEVVAFRVPAWAKVKLDAMRGPGEDRSDVLRSLVLPALADPGEDDDDT